MKKNTPQERLIHIKAESKFYSASVIVREENAVEVLTNMRDGWRRSDWRRKPNDFLKVQTCVHNPTLFP